MTAALDAIRPDKHNVCLCACEPCARGNHCRGEFCKSTNVLSAYEDADKEGATP